MNTQLAVMVLLPFLLGCGASSGHDSAGDGSHGDAVAEGTSTHRVVVAGLTCETDERTLGTLDYFPSGGGAPTPEAAARVLAKSGGDVVVQAKTRLRATAYLLRPNGTAYSQLGLVVLTDDTWRVDTMESCSGKASRPEAVEAEVTGL